MRIVSLSVLVMLLASAATVWAKDKPGKRAYPETRRTDDFDMMHGEKIPDPYRWLEADEDNEEVAAWDAAQTRLLRAHLDAYPGRAALAARIEKELDQPGLPSLPRFEAGKRWFTFKPKGANHSIVYVTDVDGKEAPKVVLDPNGWSEDGTAGLKAWQPSPNGRYVAYRRDNKGSEATTLYVRDLETGKDTADAITRTGFSPMVWEADSSGFYYVRNPDPATVPKGEEQYHRRMWFHPLGGDPEKDLLVYGDKRPMLESKWVFRSSDRKHIMLSRGRAWIDQDTFFLQREGDRFTWVPIVVGDGKNSEPDRVGDTWVFKTDRNTGNGQIFTAPALEDGTPGPWTELEIPRDDTTVLASITLVGEQAVVLTRQNVVSRIWIVPLDRSAEPKELVLPGPGTASGLTSRPGDTRLWLRFQSYSEPSTNYVCDLAQAPWTLRKLDTLPTTLAVDELVSEQMTYKSKDGTEIPIFILRHKDTKLDGSAPTVLYGYGGFKVGLFPRFSRTRALWAAEGGVWATACLRGGIEFGEAWHEAGCRGQKQNVYDDFIAAADWLVSTKRASRNRLAIYGGSNGGLLVATCINQRPDLCAAVVCSVPLTDMLRYAVENEFNKFAKMWTFEYGDPAKKEAFDWIRPYSPVHNAKPGTRYPSILVEAGLHDGRVHPYHARKITAVWQHATAGHAPILLNIDRESGHGSASLKQYRDELTDKFSFLLMELDGAR